MHPTFQIYPEVAQFIAYLQFEKRYSKHTLTAYQTDLEQFFVFLVSQYEAPSVADIAPSFVKSWLAELKQDAIAAKSLRRKISSLNAFFKFLIRRALLQNNPMTNIHSPKIPKRLPQFVDVAHMQTLLHEVVFSDDWQGKTEKLVLQLFYETGIRLSELIQLQESQVDTAYAQIKVLGKGNKERILPISRQILAQLQEYLDEKKVLQLTCTHVFVTPKNKPLQPRSVYAFVHNRLAQVTTITQKSPHILRHTFATHLMNEGAPLGAVKELLGHSSLASTQVYTHNTIEKLKDVFKKAHPKA